MINTMNHKLTQHILLALVLGVLVGLGLHYVSDAGSWIEVWLIDGLFLLLGKWLISLLMLLVVPLVLVSLIKGVGGLVHVSQLGRLSLWTIGLYLMTTAIAIGTGLMFAGIFAPGKGLSLMTSDATSSQSTDLMQILISLVPNNMFNALSQGNMLQVIVIALLFGAALSLINREKPADQLMSWLEDVDRLLLKLVSIIMLVVPIGVFALMTRSVFGLGFDLLLPLLGYAIVLISALLFHGLITYGLLLKQLTGESPLRVFKLIKPLWLFAFSTASSAASIPVTLDRCDHLGISSQVSRFSIPLGATINMDGTAIMQGVATVFIANAYSISLMPTDYALIMFTATLASIGTAAVPGAGLIMLTLVLTQVGLPVEGIALILGIDRLLDMLRTSVNVTGDVIVSYIVAHKTDLLRHPNQQNG